MVISFQESGLVDLIAGGSSEPVEGGGRIDFVRIVDTDTMFSE